MLWPSDILCVTIETYTPMRERTLPEGEQILACSSLSPSAKIYGRCFADLHISGRRSRIVPASPRAFGSVRKPFAHTAMCQRDRPCILPRAPLAVCV